MGLLDDVKPLYTPPRFRTRKYRSIHDKFNSAYDPEEGRLQELNNDGRQTVSEDFADSPFADRSEEKDDKPKTADDL